MTTKIPRVLIAANDTEKIERFKRVLSQQGFETIEVSDGPKAVMACAHLRPDVVLIDALMPILNGFESCARIKDDLTLAHIPLILVSPILITDDDIRCGYLSLTKRLELKADMYLCEPVQDLKLIEAVNKALGNKVDDDDDLKLKALVVDDKLHDRRLIKNVLRKEGLEQSYATSVKEAIDKIEVLQPDLTVLDIKLPQMSGLEVLEFLKERLPNSAVVVMAAYNSEDAIHESLRLGVDGVLLKPVNVHELKVAIHNALEKIRLRQEQKALKLGLQSAANQIMDSYDQLTRLRQQIHAKISEPQRSSQTNISLQAKSNE